MLNAGQDLALRRAVAPQLVRHDHPGHVLQTAQELAEEPLGRPGIAPALHENVEHMAVLIHGAPEVMQLAPNSDEHLVQVPLSCLLSSAAGSSGHRQHGRFTKGKTGVQGGRRAEQTTVEQALIRGLATAGPLVRLGAASVLSRASVGTGHKMATRVPLRAPPPALHACVRCAWSTCSFARVVVAASVNAGAGYAGLTSRAMAQMNPTISRAMAVVTTFQGLPRPIIAL